MYPWRVAPQKITNNSVQPIHQHLFIASVLLTLGDISLLVKGRHNIILGFARKRSCFPFEAVERN